MVTARVSLRKSPYGPAKAVVARPIDRKAKKGRVGAGPLLSHLECGPVFIQPLFATQLANAGRVVPLSHSGLSGRSRHLPRSSVLGRFRAKSPVGRAGGSSARLPNAHVPASRRSCDNILHVSSGYPISGPASHYLTFQAVPGCGCRPLPQASSGARFVPESAERTQAREPRPRSSCPRA
jgi:hypothetical protein